MMNFLRKHKKIVMLILYIGMAVFIVFYLYNYWSDFSIIFTVPIELFLLLLAFSQISIYFAAIPRKIMLNSMGYKIKFKDWFGFNAFSNFLAIIVPLRADLAVSAIHFNKEYDVKISKFGSILYGNILISIIVLSFQLIIGLSAVGIFYNNWSLPIWILAIIGIGAFCIIVILTNYISKKIKHPHKIFVFLKELLIGFSELSKNKKLFLQVIGLSLCSSVIFVIRLYISYLMVGESINIFNILLYSALLQISDFFAILPGNLGIREFILGFASGLMGTGIQQGFMAGIIMRVSAFLIFGINGGIWWIYNYFDKKHLSKIAK